MPAPGGGPSILKPEPRKLPNRPYPSEVVARQMPEPNLAGDSRKSHAAPLPRHPHTSSPLARFMWLALFLLAAGLLIFGLLKVLKIQQSGQATKNPPTPAVATPAKPAAPPSPQRKIPALPTPAPEQPSLIEPPPALPDGMEPKSPGMEALAVLEKFLAAKSLAERLPIIETKTPEPELAASCLAAPLPPAPKVLLEFQESNAMEEVVDFYYNVDFEMPGKPPNLQTILVRTRGSSTPKVVVDPFLDLFGGRLAAYASKPSDKGASFQVIVYAVASCTDPEIPNREKKLTLKLLARDNVKEIALAYFGRLSKIGELLEDGSHSLSYGKAKSCTVMLRWNTEDNPQHPYLEAIDLKALDWNP